MKTLPSCLLLAALLAGFVGGMSIVGAAPAPPEKPGQPKMRVSFPADPERIRGMEFSSDGKRMLSYGTDGTAKLWDTAKGKPIATFTGNVKPTNGREKGTISWAFLSPNGKLLATVEYDSSIRLWHVATGKKVATLTQPRGAPTFLLFSSDGKNLLSLGRIGNPNYLWDLKTKKERTIMEGLNDERRMNYLRVGAFDPKGKPLVLVRDRPSYPPSFELWTVDSNKKPAITFQIPLYKKDRSNGPRVLAFSRDCKTIASADGDWKVRLWETATGKNSAALPKLPGYPNSLAFSPDGKVLAVGYRLPLRRDFSPEEQPLPPLRVRLYEVATGKVLATLTGETGLPLESPRTDLLVFSPNGRTLATVDGGRNIILWSLPVRYAPSK